MSNDYGQIKRIIFEYENMTLTYEGEEAVKAKSWIDSNAAMAYVHGLKGKDLPVPICTPKEN